MAVCYAIARNVALPVLSFRWVLLTLVSFPQASTSALAPPQGVRRIGQCYACFLNPNPVLTL